MYFSHALYYINKHITISKTAESRNPYAIFDIRLVFYVLVRIFLNSDWIIYEIRNIKEKSSSKTKICIVCNSHHNTYIILYIGIYLPIWINPIKSFFFTLFSNKHNFIQMMACIIYLTAVGLNCETWNTVPLNL